MYKYVTVTEIPSPIPILMGLIQMEVAWFNQSSSYSAIILFEKSENVWIISGLFWIFLKFDFLYVITHCCYLLRTLNLHINIKDHHNLRFRTGQSYPAPLTLRGNFGHPIRKSGKFLFWPILYRILWRISHFLQNWNIYTQKKVTGSQSWWYGLVRFFTKCCRFLCYLHLSG